MTWRYWDRTAAIDRRVTVGRRALWISRYEGEGADPGAPVPDLAVVDHDSGTAAGWHPASGLYGFVSLPASTPRRVDISDPTGQYALRTALVDFPSRATYAASLASGTPGTPAAPPVLQLTMRPSTAWQGGAGDTIVYGDVADTDGSPAVFAWVEIEADSGVYATVTDLVGGWLVRIPGEPLPDADAFPVPAPPSYAIRVRRLRAAVPADDPYAAWPVDADVFASDPTLLDAAYGPVVYSSTVAVAPCVRTKLLITL